MNEGQVMDVPGEVGTIFGRMGLGKEMLPRIGNVLNSSEFSNS